MSGIDEQRFAPECPHCGKSEEFHLGGQQWLLTEEAMRTRGLKYSFICHRSSGPSVKALDNRFLCIPCRAYFEKDSTMGKALYSILLRQKGKTYIANLASKRECVWEV